ncbi:MAG TPA: WcaI family glycosyltransferase [Sphingomonas sp.]|nr:WcaI family glycosyltransferase [Sphingomonas sp.]
MRILVVGLNYAPELVGIGPYTAGTVRALIEAGHEIEVIAGKPYYPAWKTDAAFDGGLYRKSREGGAPVTRCAHYVPARPSGAKRILHHLSFAAAALPQAIRAARRFRPDLVFTVAPSMIAVPAARIAARIARAPLWIHVQDFEVEAAFATGLVDGGGMAAKLARRFEAAQLAAADRVSTISPQMGSKLRDKGVAEERIVEFRNWADVDRVRPLESESAYRAEWGVERPHVALYSGNIANKQGIEIVVEAARLLRRRRDLQFVICGQGPNRARLAEATAELDNVMLRDLQPTERLGELLGLADVHLLPQIVGAADLVLPSKLTNMLASGRPVVATAAPGTGLADEVEGCGIVTPPGDARAFAEAIERLIDDPGELARLGRAARARAEERWSRAGVLGRFTADLDRLSGAPTR